MRVKTLRTLIWFAYFWLYLLVVEPLRLKVRRYEKNGDTAAHDALTRQVVGRWARRLLALAGAKITVEGLENLPDGPAVYVSNHLGYFDIPLMLGYLGEDTKPLVAKKQIEKIPLIRSWMKELHCVFIDRDNPRASMQALNEAIGWVKNGYSMVIFPEGTRSKTGEMAEFKAGAFRIAQKNNVPVVPLCIKGTDYLMERNGYWIHPGKVTLKILPLIDTASYTKEDWRALPALAESEVRKGLAEI